MNTWLNRIFCEDALEGLARLPDASVDLLIADPPYGLGKDYGNDSDKLDASAYLAWMEQWVDIVLPKLKHNGSLYIFLTWRYSPEIFVMLKKRMTMVNEIIWDRRVPSMGGSTRKFSSVHDTIGFFAKAKDYHFDIDAVRIPYDAETKKARSRSIFVGSKWLELGYNPKDAEAARNHRAHDQGFVPAGRRGARSLHGQRHDRRGGETLCAELRRLRTESRILPVDRNAAGRARRPGCLNTAY
jgi:site-specific DNA-methyltransferase (adenine-specific)